MNQYDNYNPEIFYPEETAAGTPLPPAPDAESTRKRRDTARKKAVSASRAGGQRKEKSNGRQGAESDKGVISSIKASMTSLTARLICGISVAGLAAFLTTAFISYFSCCVKDQSVVNNNPVGSLPDVANKAGEGGARLSEFLINEGFGLGSFVIILWLFAMALKLLSGRPGFKTVNFTIKCLVALVTLSLIVGLLTLGLNTPVNWGGYHGRYVNEFIIGFFGWWGAAILCMAMIAIFVIICMRDFVNWVIRKRRVIAEKRRVQAELREQARQRELEIEEMRRREEVDAVRAGEANGVADDEKRDDDPSAVAFDPQDLSHDDGYNAAYQLAEEDSEERPSLLTADLAPEISSDVVATGRADAGNVSANDEDAAAESSVPADNTSAGVSNPDTSSQNQSCAPSDAESDDEEPVMTVNVNQIEQAEAESQALLRHDSSAYCFPPVELLEERPAQISVDADEQLLNKEKIRKTLLDFGIPIVSIEATVGPTVTLYEVRPDKGHKVAKIKSLVDDISLSLSATGVRIIAPIPGKGTVGIEVANRVKQTVSMRTLIQSRKYQESKAALPLALGSTISNEVYIADLASIPHLLVAGATGQGKSVGLNVIISSILYKKRPDELKFVLFDPKMVEFSLYAAIEKQYLAMLPDAEEAIITDMSKVVPTLSSLCIEMDNRYRLLKSAEVRKVEEYNALVKAGRLSAGEGHKFLPYIVVVVDEFADLMMTAGKEVEIPIARLAQKARAVGIHVIIATQRPSANVITGNIKTNFPGRIGFKVSSGVDSKVILDATGAQQLIGKGDMLILNNSEMTRVQCAFIDTPEVKHICEHISRQPYPASDSPYILPEPLASESSGMADCGLNVADKDPLFDEIKQYVVTSGTASTSNLQRRYGIGYNRAGKIMDQLEEAGIVGPSMGGKPRTVLVNSI